MTQQNLDTMTPAELRKLCDERGVSYRQKDSSSQLRTKLAKSAWATDTRQSNGLSTPVDVEPTGTKPTAAEAKAHRDAKTSKESKLLAAVSDVLAGADPIATADALVADAPAASDDRSERTKLAKAEHKLLQAWIKDGEKPPRPSTPNLDALNADYEARGGKPAKRTKAKGKSTTTRVSVTLADGFRFYRDGKPYTDRDNGRLSNIAARAKISASELHDAMTSKSLTLDSTWTLTVSSGVVIELRDERKSSKRKAS